MSMLERTLLQHNYAIVNNNNLDDDYGEYDDDNDKDTFLMKQRYDLEIDRESWELEEGGDDDNELRDEEYFDKL